MSASFDAKESEFFEIYGVCARTRGVELARTFCRQGGKDKFFAILCGRLLRTAP